MRVVGVIAEYNPLHNGHIYHLEQAKRKTGASYCVVIMSGNFVQRGEPACTDKFTRAQWALEAGADLVIELPRETEPEAPEPTEEAEADEEA